MVLVISQTPDWVGDLEQICKRAWGSKGSLDSDSLQQQVIEWQARLSEK